MANAGGLPFILPILDATLAAEMIGSLDGLVLAGGGDIDPALYGEDASPEVSGVDSTATSMSSRSSGRPVRLGSPRSGFAAGYR